MLRSAYSFPSSCMFQIFARQILSEFSVSLNHIFLINILSNWPENTEFPEMRAYFFMQDYLPSHLWKQKGREGLLNWIKKKFRVGQSSLQYSCDRIGVGSVSEACRNSSGNRKDWKVSFLSLCLLITSGFHLQFHAWDDNHWVFSHIFVR